MKCPDCNTEMKYIKKWYDCYDNEEVRLDELWYECPKCKTKNNQTNKCPKCGEKLAFCEPCNACGYQEIICNYCNAEFFRNYPNGRIEENKEYFRSYFYGVTGNKIIGKRIKYEEE